MDNSCTIQILNTKRQLKCKKGENLKQVLQAEGIFLPAFCGGRGSCKKCEVLIWGQGRKPACQISVTEDMELTLLSKDADEKEYQVTGHTDREVLDSTKDTDSAALYAGSYKIAVDIGTTTLVFSLLNAKNGKLAGVYTALNSSRMYGGDVVSRLQAAIKGQGVQLQSCMQKDLAKGIAALLKSYAIQAEQIQEIAVSGNTVMLHLLRGYSCQGFCSYPFTPVTLAMERLTAFEVLGQECVKKDTPMLLLPGITAFVGADITAGMYFCFANSSETNGMLLDLGTNGELVLKAGKTFYVASVAAGPAFEGGNIVWGSGSIAGAISGVSIGETGIAISTIGGQPPIGICGTGLIELIAEGIRCGVIDGTGKLAEAYFTEGFPVANTKDGRQIVVTQADIRQFQMAKAAVCTGIELLLQHAGLTCQEIETVYLAGGFGCYLDMQKAAAVGLLPKELAGKTKVLGNTALLGTEKFLFDTHGRERLEAIVNSSIELPLALQENFQEKYIENINIPILTK